MGVQKQGAHNSKQRQDGQPLTDSAPISEDQFQDMMDVSMPSSMDGGVAVAVSGGADSMALCLLVFAWAKTHNLSFMALTVDHGIRPAAQTEAKQVQQWLSDRDIPHQTLTATDVAPQSNLQAWARDVRYSLMEDWCAAHQVGALLLAHHLEDQAETLLLRLGRGSGVDGLSAMATQVAPRFESGPWRVRPLLDVPKARLLETLKHAGQDWIEDPTNQDTKYARNRLRRMSQSLAEIGLTPQRLAKTAKTMRRTKEALDDAARRLREQALRIDEVGYCLLSVPAFSRAPEDVQLRLLGRLLAALGGQAFSPREERLQSMLAAILDNGLGGGRTLSGCRVVPENEQSDVVMICRESRSVADAIDLAVDKPTNWDRRYRLRVSGDQAGRLTVGRLSADGWAMIRKISPELLKQSPRMAGINLPAVRRNDELVAVPGLGFTTEGTEITVDIEFIALRRL
jgi:tRNA(Ile)-lysidine synthase